MLRNLDTLYPTQKNSAVFNSGAVFEIRDFCEILKLYEGTQVLARYGSDFYENTPVVTMNNYGRGKAVYVGARIDAAGMEQLYRQIFAVSGMAAQTLPDGVEHYVRWGYGQRFDFYLNSNAVPVDIDNVAPGSVLLGGESGDEFGGGKLQAWLI